MKIRTKLTIQFVAFTAIILLGASTAIYLFSNEYRIEDFYARLYNKANNTAKLLLEFEEIDAELLFRIEKDNPASLPNEKIIIFDYKNNILFSTDEEQVIKYDDNLLNRIRLEEKVRIRQDGYEILGLLFTSKYDRFTIIAAAEDIYGISKIKNLQKILFIVSALSLLLLLYIGWIYSGRALKPISRIINDVNKISASNLDLRLSEGKSKDELEQLAHTFNKMLVSLEIAFKSQKNFIANASHELRTPLMAITGQIEYILLNRRTEEEYESILDSIYEDIRILNNLLNRLLMLAQTNTDVSQTVSNLVRVDEVLWQAFEEINNTNPGSKISISMSEMMTEENMTIKGDEQLLKTAFLNLMENACKYSKNEPVDIKMGLFGSEFLIVEIKDIGIGIPENEIQNITKPFFRGSNSQHVKGHGIGLSLVDRIIKLHLGSIEINSKVGKGTQVMVKLPLSGNPHK